MGRQPCCEKEGLKRGPWTTDEDSKLVQFILNNGIQCWRLVPKLAGLMRCGKSCRLRWINYLRPDLKRGAFTEAEEDMIIQLHSRLGNRWSKIAAHLPGRTDNEIKNHWNTKIKKKLKVPGLNPLTHKPLLDQDEEQVVLLAQKLDHSPETTGSPYVNGDCCHQTQTKAAEAEEGAASLIFSISNQYQVDRNENLFDFVSSATMMETGQASLVVESSFTSPMEYPWIDDPFFYDGFAPFGHYCFP